MENIDNLREENRLLKLEVKELKEALLIREATIARLKEQHKTDLELFGDRTQLGRANW